MITLQQQIEAQERFARTCDLGRLDMANALLASLRRLQDIEQQEPVAYHWFSSKWQANECHSADDLPANAPNDKQPLYALPVSPEVLHIPYADEWKKNVMRLWTCARKHDSDIPDAQLDFMRDYLLKASEVSHD